MIMTFPRNLANLSPKQVTFLLTCKEALCEDDYFELLDAIENVEGFYTAEEDIQTLAEAFLAIRAAESIVI